MVLLLKRNHVIPHRAGRPRKGVKTKMKKILFIALLVTLVMSLGMATAMANTTTGEVGANATIMATTIAEYSVNAILKNTANVTNTGPCTGTFSSDESITKGLMPTAKNDGVNANASSLAVTNNNQATKTAAHSASTSIVIGQKQKANLTGGSLIATELAVTDSFQVATMSYGLDGGKYIGIVGDKKAQMPSKIDKKAFKLRPVGAAGH